MTGQERVEKAADQAFGLIPSGYDLKYGECCHLVNMAGGGTDGVFRAIATAFRAGFLRGHLATKRGRIK